MENKTQHGFAHMAIIAIVAIALTVGTLGVVYYNNFVINKDSTGNTQESNQANNQVVENVSNDESANTDEIAQNTDESVLEDKTEPTKGTVTSIDNAKLYSGALCSFEFPSSGWAIESSDDESTSVSINTSDYKSGPMGAESGSSITIEYESDLTSSSDLINGYISKGILKADAVSEIAVDGQTAYKYLFSYEFGYYNTVFNKGEKVYSVMLDGPNDTSKIAYDQVLNTLKIK